MNRSFEKEFVILGLKRITGGHGAVNTKKFMQEIVNGYKFDKKISR